MAANVVISSILSNRRSSFRPLLTISALKGGNNEKSKEKKVRIKHKPKNNTFTISENDGIITILYYNDLNILNLHRLLIKMFKKRVGSDISALVSKLEHFKGVLSTLQTIVDKKYTIAKYSNIVNMIDNLTKGKDINEYFMKAKPYLDEYSKIGALASIVSFRGMGDGINNQEPELARKNRLRIIGSYLKISKKFFDIRIVRETEDIVRCNICGEDLSSYSSNDEGLITCPNPYCSVEIPILSKTVYSEGEVFKNTQSNYENRNNFWKAMMRYQGKQVNRLHKDFESILDEYFSFIGLPPGAKIREFPLNRDRSRGKTSKRLLFKALKDTGLSGHYEDANLICNIYWGWPLPDVSHLEELAMRDYDIAQNIFEDEKGDRKSCLNIEYRLWRHLSRLGHLCKPTDFKLVTTDDTIDYHESTWISICEKAGWEQPVPLP